jgi:riboflavin synthase
MFTGIVENVGEISMVEENGDGLRVGIKVPWEDELKKGVSVCVSGVCLTVESHSGDGFVAFLSTETLNCSNLKELREGSFVNLERSMPYEGRFDGHIVQGHVDTTTEIIEINQIGEDWEYGFRIPDKFGKYMVKKGSIAIDGIGLTIADINEEKLTVAIIPTTYSETTLCKRRVGDEVNIEVDILAKYTERLLAK